MAVITITPEYGTESGKVVSQLSEKLGYEYIGEKLQSEIAQQLNLSESEVEVFRKASQSKLIRFMDRYTCSLVQKVVDPKHGCLDDADYYATTTKLVEKLYAADNVVILNWGAQCILKGKPNAVHVRLIRDQESKIKQAMKSLELDQTAAEKHVAQEERNSAHYIKQFFDMDWNDVRLYDLVIDMDTTAPEKAVEMICDHLARKLH